MALGMSRPFKHPTTGVYYFRKAVPEDLRPLVGRREEKRSLRTKDPKEARLIFAEVAAEVSKEWIRLRSEPTALSRRDATALAGRWYRWFTVQHEDAPGDTAEGWAMLFEQLRDLDRFGVGHPDEPDEYDRTPATQERVNGFLATQGRLEEFLAGEGVKLSSSSHGVFYEALEAEFVAALRLFSRRAEGDYGRDRWSERHPEWRPDRHAAVSLACSLTNIFDGWARETEPASKTLYSFRRIKDQLAAHLGHEDASRITTEDLLGWKDKLVADGKSKKTIRDAQLAPIRALLGWAVKNKRLSQNPATGIKLADDKGGPSRRGFRDAEARAILEAARRDTRLHYRWVPWVCALSGARIAEVCQLRAEDIRDEDGAWIMHFSWDAGRLKNTGSDRRVPVHSALVTEGFLDFVRTIKAGPLFKEISPDRFGSRGGNGTKILSRWVREVVKITDENVGPNHSWRHRFKSLCRAHGIDKEFHDALTGHRPGDEGSNYGEVPIPALAREIEKLPHPLA